MQFFFFFAFFLFNSSLCQLFGVHEVIVQTAFRRKRSHALNRSVPCDLELDLHRIQHSKNVINTSDVRLVIYCIPLPLNYYVGFDHITIIFSLLFLL